jgi:hypothetical protein
LAATSRHAPQCRTAELVDPYGYMWHGMKATSSRTRRRTRSQQPNVSRSFSTNRWLRARTRSIRVKSLVSMPWGRRTLAGDCSSCSRCAAGGSTSRVSSCYRAPRTRSCSSGRGPTSRARSNARVAASPACRARRQDSSRARDRRVSRSLPGGIGGH